MIKLRNHLRVLCGAVVSLSLAACAGTIQERENDSWRVFDKITHEKQLAVSIYQREIEQLLDSQRHSGTFKGKADVELAYERYLHPNEKQDIIVFISGRSESYLKYRELIYDLYRNGYSVFVYDHRGQGLSDRVLRDENDKDKGYVDSFDDYVEDLNTFLEQNVMPTTPRNVFLLAHSMGGAVASLWAERHPKGATAIALTSPMHQPTLPLPLLLRILLFPIKDMRDRYICKYYVEGKDHSEWVNYAGGGPVQLDSSDFTDSEKNDITQSRVRFERFLAVLRSDPKVQLSGVTWKWVAEACRGAREAVENASNIQIPVLLLQAGADTVVRSGAQVRFCVNYGRCDGGEVVVVKGAKHELLIESDKYRAEALGRILEFFEKYRSWKPTE